MQYVNKAAIRVGFAIPSNNNMSVSVTVDLYMAIKQLFLYTLLRINHKRWCEGNFGRQCLI